MITSRPDESDEMKVKDIYFDRYVEITGFSEPQVKEYIAKYFKNNDRTYVLLLRIYSTTIKEE